MVTSTHYVVAGIAGVATFLFACEEMWSDFWKDWSRLPRGVLSGFQDLRTAPFRAAKNCRRARQRVSSDQAQLAALYTKLEDAKVMREALRMFADQPPSARHESVMSPR